EDAFNKAKAIEDPKERAAALEEVGKKYSDYLATKPLGDRERTDMARLADKYKIDNANDRAMYEHAKRVEDSDKQHASLKKDHDTALEAYRQAQRQYDRDPGDLTGKGSGNLTKVADTQYPD